MCNIHAIHKTIITTEFEHVIKLFYKQMTTTDEF